MNELSKKKQKQKQKQGKVLQYDVYIQTGFEHLSTSKNAIVRHT